MRQGRAALKQSLASILAETGKKVAAQIRNAPLLTKISPDGIDLSSLDVIVDDAPEWLASVAGDAGRASLAQLGMKRDALVNQVNEEAVQYARYRAAEMIGKTYNEAGDLVDNPDAKWRIDEATRDEIRRIISQGLDDNIGKDEIADMLEDALPFSEERAELIAQTEIARANQVGVLESYHAAQDAGVKVLKEWLPDAEACEVCLENADAGAIPIEDDFPSGDDAPPAHPHCECALVPLVVEDEEPAAEE